MFTTFRAAEKPQAVRFADGREETLPDLTSVVKPSRLGDFATYTLLGAGGIFFGGETGLLTGGLRGELLRRSEEEIKSLVLGHPLREVTIANCLFLQRGSRLHKIGKVGSGYRMRLRGSRLKL